MDDSNAPAPKNLSRECEHKWADVTVENKKTLVVGPDKLVSETKVYFCNSCKTVLGNAE